jgi:hypothetical protein
MLPGVLEPVSYKNFIPDILLQKTGTSHPVISFWLYGIITHLGTKGDEWT